MNFIFWSFLSSVLFFQVTAQADSSLFVWNDVLGVQKLTSCQPVKIDGKTSQKAIAQFFDRYAEQIVEIIDIPKLQKPSTLSSMLNGSYLQMASENGEPKVVSCAAQPEKLFVVFDVYSDQLENSIERIGMTRSDSSLFHHSQILSNDQIESLAKTESTTSNADGASVIDPFEETVCSSLPLINVYDESLNKVVFSVPNGELVQRVQSWSINKKYKMESRKNNLYIKVLFPDLKKSAGNNQIATLDAKSTPVWIAESLVQSPSKCSFAKPTVVDPIKILPAPALAKAVSGTFPTLKRATASYKTGARAFNSPRSGGKRSHAACDIYRVNKEKAVAVKPGKVIRGLYFFYQGTYALEVVQGDGKVVRYGEISGTAAPNIKSNANLAEGQTIGYISKVNSGCCEPMLHFEMYSGKATGALTQSGNKFQRRSDLINPSSYLTDWEKAKFGVAY